MLGAPRASAEQAPSTVLPPVTHQGHHHRHHHKRRSRKSKHQQSTSVQFPDPESSSEPSWVTSENVNVESLLPSHTIHVKRIDSSDELVKNVNIALDQDFAHTIPECSIPDKVCDVSPLENLLAVAELELKQHMQSGEWVEPQEHTKSIKDANESENPSIEEIDELLKAKAHEMQIEITEDEQKSPECSYNDDDEISMNDILSRLEQSLQSPQGFGSDNTFDDEISEPDGKSDKAFFNSVDNNKCTPDKYIGMPEMSGIFDTDIEGNDSKKEPLDGPQIPCFRQEKNSADVAELENETEYTKKIRRKTDCSSQDTDVLQNELVQSVEYTDFKTEENETGGDCTVGDKIRGNNCDISSYNQDHTTACYAESIREREIHQVSISTNKIYEEEKPILYQSQGEQKFEQSTKNQISEAESSIIQEDPITPPKQEPSPEETAVCLDLSIKKTAALIMDTVEETTGNKYEENSEGPTDLSIRKNAIFTSQLSRPVSRSSEHSQSPQPSGIPAVPPSPDIVSNDTFISKSRSAFLESLLANSINKIPFSSNAAITSQKEALDLGQCRKSASPTVTCSEEILTLNSESEPPPKKLKPEEITLRNLLDKDEQIKYDLKKMSSKEASTFSETPKLLSLLKVSSNSKDPLTEYKQLLTEIDIPNPLMVPKDYFPDLLQHPRREILKILTGHSNNNVPLDDILVIYKDKLLAAIETSQNNSSKNINKNGGYAVPNRSTLPKPIEKNSHNTEKPVQVSSKRKNNEGSLKGSILSPDNKSSLASDIDAANEAALFWAGFPNAFEAMATYSNHNDFIQALYAASAMPYFPSQIGELNPALQMTLGNKISPLNFQLPSPINFSNPFELSMWQEAMMQVNMLKDKNPYENPILNQPNYKTSLENKRVQLYQSDTNKFNSKPVANGHNKNTTQSQQMQQQSSLQNSYGQAVLGNETGWQNPYLGLSGYQQGSNNLTLTLPQINSLTQRNNITSASKHSQQLSPSLLHKQNKELHLKNQCNEQDKRLHRQMIQEQQKMQQTQRQKMLRQQQHQQFIHQQPHMLRQANKQHPLSLGKKQIPGRHFNSLKDCIQDKSLTSDSQKMVNPQGPIDLSGVQSKPVKKYPNITGNCQSNSTVTSSKGIADDIPEVGSTTGSIEEIQDGHAQLWHPLFGK